MERLPIFSSYSQGENRVSSSILAVLARIELRLVEELLQRMAGGDPIELVRISPQFTRKGVGDSVPDGGIMASAQVLFEFKVVPNSLTAKQLRGHCGHFSHPSVQPCWLIAVTPDQLQPEVVDTVDAELAAAAEQTGARIRCVWCSYADVSAAIDEVIALDTESVAERDRFLLRELQTLIERERLIAHEETLVVAARSAWDEYLAHGVYVYQHGRSFRAASHLGFYRANAIKDRVAKILGVFDIEVTDDGEVIVDTELAGASELAERVAALAADGGRGAGLYSAMLLSRADETETIQLPQDIENDQTGPSGRRVAWTQQQRYMPTAAIHAVPAPARTSEIDLDAK
jgi:hypothetical protein